MKRTIKTQLLISFIGLSVIILGAFSWITLTLMETHFADYIEERYDSELARYTSNLESLFSKDKSWENHSQEIGIIGQNALQNSIILRVYDENDTLLWEPSSYETKNTHMMMDHSNQMQHMRRMMPSVEDNVVQTQVPLLNNGEEVGRVEIQSMGALTYTIHDALFISDMRKSLVIVALISLLIAFFFALLVSKKFSSPIVAIQNFTKEISKGRYPELALKQTGIQEIDSLMTSVKDLSNQLQRQQEIRNRLSSDIAHEIRTPLTTLKGNIEAMIDGVWEVTEERLLLCHNEVNRIARLIGQIDQINELESHETVLEKTRFDLMELLQQVVHAFQPLFRDKDIHYTITGDALYIVADRDKMNQVATNLLANALKFTPPAGEIEIHTYKEKQKAFFEIKDTGQGIPPEEVNQIFERFYMAEPSRNKNISGQGIGLSIVKGIIQAHQGQIAVKSEYGKGTSFLISLPLIQ